MAKDNRKKPVPPPSTAPKTDAEYLEALNNALKKPSLRSPYTFTIPSTYSSFPLYNPATGNIKLPTTGVIMDKAIETKIVIDPTMKSDGFADFNPETSVFTVTVPPYVTVENINVERVAEHYHANQRTSFANIYNYADIFTISIDESAKPSCKWYSPSDDELKKGAVQVKKYPYNRGRSDPSCSNPAVSGAKGQFVKCEYHLRFNECNYSEFENWETLTVAYNEDVPVVSLQRKLYGRGMPCYRVFDHTTDAVVVEKTDNFKTVKNIFDEQAKDFLVKDSKTDRHSYFKAVLT